MHRLGHRTLLATTAAFSILVAGCGSDDGGASTGADQTEPADAQTVLTEALERQRSDRYIEFTTTVDLGIVTTNSGKVNLEQKASDTALTLDADAIDEQGMTIRARIIGDRVYGGPSVGPLSSCWFDYSGLGIEEADDHWMHPAVRLAQGADQPEFRADSSSEVTVLVSALDLLSLTMSKLINTTADQVGDKDPQTQATITIEDGTITSLVGNLGAAMENLEDDGIDLVTLAAKGLETTKANAEMYLDSHADVDQEINYSTVEAFTVETPPADTLLTMDEAAGMSEENPPPCATVAK